MAGYLFSLSSEDSLEWCIENGIYSTNLTNPKNTNWGTHHEGTFGDYISMKPGDNVYFFIKRKIYGIGELIKVGCDCKYKNYPDSLQPTIKKFTSEKDKMLINKDDKNINNRVICTFKANPNFFKCGIDMDDVLMSNPIKFKILRAFWKLSFVKVDDEENKALEDIILKRNEKFINGNEEVYNFNDYEHKRIESIVSSKQILQYASNDSCIKHEMAIEVAILVMGKICNKRDNPNLRKS